MGCQGSKAHTSALDAPSIATAPAQNTLLAGGTGEMQQLKQAPAKDEAKEQAGNLLVCETLVVPAAEDMTKPQAEHDLATTETTAHASTKEKKIERQVASEETTPNDVAKKAPAGTTEPEEHQAQDKVVVDAWKAETAQVRTRERDATKAQDVYPSLVTHTHASNEDVKESIVAVDIPLQLLPEEVNATSTNTACGCFAI